MVNRLETALPKMLEEAALEPERENVRRQFDRVGSTPARLLRTRRLPYFKGEGSWHTERYHGQGWGLLQVLEGMRGSGKSSSAVKSFALGSGRFDPPRANAPRTQRITMVIRLDPSS